MLALMLCSAALAHQAGLSYASIQPETLVLQVSRAELGDRLPPGDDLGALARELDALILKRVTVERGGQPCALSAPSVRIVPPAAGGLDTSTGLELTSALSCPADGEMLYRVGFFDELTTGHRHYVEVAGEPLGVLDAGHPEIRFGGPAPSGSVAGRFLSLGVEHIWTGYDHLLFLFGLLLTASSLRAMLLIVTGFTVAHSITLSLAALGVVVLPSSVVEPAIAATIAFVGVENLWKPPARRRVVLTFFLGLIHGFGFASVLADAGLPRESLVMALVCFNGGVELGQGAVVALCLPLLLWCKRFPAWDRWAVPVGSIGVALAGLVWFIQRVV